MPFERRTATLCVIAVVLMASVEAAGQATDGGTEPLNTGLVYGVGHAFFLSAPDGWILDNQSGAARGLHAVFYPVGSTWQSGLAVMYANTAGREPTQDLDSFVRGDVDQLRSDGRCNVEMTAGPSIETTDKKKAVVKNFSGEKCNSEAVAYIQEEKVFVLLVLTARTTQAYEDALPAFTRLVKSYEFMTKDVRIEN